MTTMDPVMLPDSPLLIRVSGADRPRLTRDLLALLGNAGAVLEDMELLVWEMAA